MPPQRTQNLDTLPPTELKITTSTSTSKPPKHTKESLYAAFRKISARKTTNHSCKRNVIAELEEVLGTHENDVESLSLFVDEPDTHTEEKPTTKPGRPRADYTAAKELWLEFFRFCYKLEDKALETLQPGAPLPPIGLLKSYIRYLVLSDNWNYRTTLEGVKIIFEVANTSGP